MRIAFTVLILAASLAAQSNAPTGNVPTKDDPRGFSKDVLTDTKPAMSDLGERRIYEKGAPPMATVATPVPEDLQKLVTAQFGAGCKVAMERSAIVVNYRNQKKDESWSPFFTADLDHDGVPDAIIVARCENPVARKDEFGYVLTDPYMTYHGYGDPKITQEFASGDPTQGHVVLIIHGVGPEGWRASKPKAKFLVLNLPFNKLDITQIAPKKGKPPVDAILLQEGETMSSVVWWDGKKYRWRDSTMMD